MGKQEELSDEERVMKSMYPDLEYTDDEEDGDGQQQGKTVADLEKELAELRGQVSATPKVTRKAAPMAGLPKAPMQPVLDPKQLPDPVEDPQGYAVAIQNFNQDMMRYNSEVQQFQSQVMSRRQGQLDALWETFEASYPDYAAKPRRVQLAAKSVAESARARGVDLDKYMYEQSDQFMQDVIAEMDELWEPMTVEGTDDGEEDNRTDIVASPRGKNAKNKGGKQKEKLGSIADDVREWQLKTGFHR